MGKDLNVVVEEKVGDQGPGRRLDGHPVAVVAVRQHVRRRARAQEFDVFL